ncbi:MAG: hypothetical protein PF517_01415 [Salinivirgaceae bacterium]|jgi:hypothetical protein|nr:hypothetical protein [Salinivirgaceae bacterium]
MKRFTKQLLLLVLCAIGFIPAQAQLINQFKKETGVCSYLQFPTQKERKSKIEIKVIEENMLGTIAKKVIKNDAIAGALTGEGGVFGDEIQRIEMDLIPGVFVTDGDLLAEVSYSAEFKSKKTMWLPEETYNTMSPSEGSKIQALVSFKVYTLPDKQLIYSQDKMWVNGMMKKSTSNTTSSGNVSMTSGSAIESATKRMVTSWSKGKLDMLYGMGIRNKTLTSYMIKKQEKADRKAAKVIQAKLVGCINTLRKDRTGDAYNAELDECIAHYNKMIKKHKPGTKKQREALVTDKNVWCMYYNLAAANLLKGNESAAKANIEKALKIRIVKTKVIKNKKGEKIGEASGMIPSGYFEIGALKGIIDSYFGGVKNMPKEFVAFLNSEDDMRNATSLAREWGANILLSTEFGLETPANFKPGKISDGAKSYTGSVTEGNKIVNFVFKPAFFIPTFGYALTATDADNTIKSKIKYYNGSLRPKGATYRNSYQLGLGDDKYVTLASGNYYKTGKELKTKLKLNVGASNAKGNKKPFSGVKFQYDYNGDILITCVIHHEKWLFYGWVCDNADEYLGITRSQVRVKHNNFTDVTGLQISNTKIERQRNAKFFEAFMKKSTTGKFPADEILNETKTKTIDISKKTANNDEHGNNIEEKILKSVVKREFVY